MRVYADTSFLVKLITQELGTADAVAIYRRLNRPPLFFLPLHSLEVANAISQRAFHQRRSTPASMRATIARERDAALASMENFIARRVFVECAVGFESAITAARALSVKHTERLGCRAFDLLHVALALELESEAFLTADRVQGQLARAAGLTVTVATG